MISRVVTSYQSVSLGHTQAMELFVFDELGQSIYYKVPYDGGLDNIVDCWVAQAYLAIELTLTLPKILYSSRSSVLDHHRERSYRIHQPRQFAQLCPRTQ